MYGGGFGAADAEAVGPSGAVERRCVFGVVFHHHLCGGRCGRAVSMKPPPSTPFMARAMDILDAARFRHVNGTWFWTLFLVMTDHIHLIAKFPMGAAAVSSKPPYRANPTAVSSKPTCHAGRIARVRRRSPAHGDFR